MKLYVIRHATAEEPGQVPDAGRSLSPQGQEEAKVAGRALKNLGIPIDLILSSPRARARETAELIAAGFAPPPPVEIREALAAGATPDDFLKEISHATGRQVAIVGHQPDLGRFVAVVLDRSGSGSYAFKPASIFCLDVDPDFRVRPLWFRSPEDLAELARGPLRPPPAASP